MRAVCINANGSPAAQRFLHAHRKDTPVSFDVAPRAAYSAKERDKRAPRHPSAKPIGEAAGEKPCLTC